MANWIVRSRYVRHICLFLACLCRPSLAAPPASRPALERLVDAAPVVRSDDPELGTFEFAGRFLTAVRFRIVGQGPNEMSLHLWDAVDDTPLMVSAAHEVVVYDPINGCVVHVSPATFRFVLQCIGDDVKCSAGPGYIHEGAEWKYDVVIDTRSFFRNPRIRELRLDSMAAGESRLYPELVGTSEHGSLTTAAVDLSGGVPRYVRLKMLDYRKLNEPDVLLDRLSVGEPVAQDAFVAPDVDALRKQIRVDDFGPLSRGDVEPDLARAFRMMMCRLAIRSPEMRRPAEDEVGKVDWDAVEKRDREHSALLRKILGTPQAEAKHRP